MLHQHQRILKEFCKLNTSDQVLDIEALQRESAWKEKIHFFESIGSTNDMALELGEAGAPEGTLVIAEEQTEGRGQFGRPWFSRRGGGLWISLLMRPSHIPKIISSLSRFGAVALCDAINQEGIVVKNLTIKEPNDVLIDGKKVAGVLVETRLGKSSFAVIGIGLNVFQQQDDFPEELRDRVTSLAQASPESKINRQHIANTLLQTLHQRYQELLYSPEKLNASFLSFLSLRSL